MTSAPTASREIELELILPSWNGAFPADCPRLAVNYFIEDRRENGTGLVISEDMPPTGNLNKAITDFLTPISQNSEVLKAFSPILRVAVYNRAFSCSMNIACLPLVVSFCAELDIVVYPTADDDVTSVRAMNLG
jgi:hypothetical protein